MPNIRVDYQELENGKTAVDRYVHTMEICMRNAQNDVTQLAYSWQGSDYEEFKTAFRKVNDRDSAHQKMRRALNAYGSYLSYAKKQYRAAQLRALARASYLPRW